LPAGTVVGHRRLEMNLILAAGSSAFDWLTFAVAVVALVVALGSAAFECYRWNLEREESNPKSSQSADS
jgi:hypothetical protein